MYYYVDSFGQQQGPVAANDLRRNGVTPQTLVWRQGMSEWQPAVNVAELSVFFAASTPPPLPVTPPPPPPLASPNVSMLQRKQPQSQQQLYERANPLIDMLSQNVRKWKEVTAHITQKYATLIPEEKEAFGQLDEYWKKHDFDAGRCEHLLELLAKGKKKHPTDRALLENLQDYRRLCKDYYTQDRAVYEAFQEAMGGKGSKKTSAIPKPDAKQQQRQPQPKPREKKIIYGHNRIDYPNGDVYIGEYRNQQPNGKGKMTRVNGSWEEGNFLNGELHGQGKLYNPMYKVTKSGTFVHGKLITGGKLAWEATRVEYRWDNGDRFEGVPNAGEINYNSLWGTYYYRDGRNVWDLLSDDMPQIRND